MKSALRSGDLTKVKGIINPSNVNQEDEYGNTPIMMTSNRDVIDYLLSIGADINHENREGDTALSNTINSFFPEKDIVNNIKFLINRGANVNHVNKQGKPIMVTVIRSKSIVIAKLFIFTGANIDFRFGPQDAFTILYHSVGPKEDEDRYKKFFQFLLRCNIKVRDKILYDQFGFNPFDEFYILLQRIYDMIEPNVTGHGSYNRPFTIGDIELFQKVINNGYLALLNYWKLQKDKYGKSYYEYVINYVHDGDTALHLAVRNSNNPEMISVLIDDGFDLHHENEHGETPMQLLRNKPELLKMYNSKPLISNKIFLIAKLRETPTSLVSWLPRDVVVMTSKFL